MALVWKRGEGNIRFLSCIESLRLIFSLMLEDMFAVCKVWVEGVLPSDRWV